MEKQYKFLKTLCNLFDGENWVSEEDIRKVWKRCPPHTELVNIVDDSLVNRHPLFSEHSYMPTPQGFKFVKEYEDSRKSFFVPLATLIIAALTLLATLFQLFFK